MKETNVAGAYLVETRPRADARGFFNRVWCRKEFANCGLNTTFVQCNTSFNARRGTLRGLHCQTAPFEDAKLVNCIRGAVYDVLVDLRKESRTFGRWFGQVLTPDSHSMVYVPEGCAHGYMALEAGSEIMYFVSQFYHPEAETGIRWNDPAFAIEWPDVGPPFLSSKDQAWPDYIG
jgi:dTDP-4-dehydrorhamnose 3,5-epimerase